MKKDSMFLKLPNKLFILFNLILFTIIGKAQSNGLAVDMQYEQRIQDMRYQNQQLNKANAERYSKFMDDYTYALGSNIIKDTPKHLPNSGSFDIILTNTGRIFEKAEAFVLNNKVISITTSKGKMLTPKSSSEIQNFRCIVVMSDDMPLELIFTYLFN